MDGPSPWDWLGRSLPEFSSKDIPSQYPWYAIRVRTRYEKAASQYLRVRGYEEFLPLYMCRRRWSDRVKLVEFPLFDGYVFCRFDAEKLVPILSAPGVAYVVEFDGRLAEVPATEIAKVRQLVKAKLPASPCPYLREGMRVRVRSGPLNGFEGLLAKIRNQFRLVLSVDMLQRSVMVEIDAEAVEPLK